MSPHSMDLSNASDISVAEIDGFAVYWRCLDVEESSLSSKDKNKNKKANIHDTVAGAVYKRAPVRTENGHIVLILFTCFLGPVTSMD